MSKKSFILVSYDGISTMYCGIGTLTKTIIRAFNEFNEKKHKYDFYIIGPGVTNEVLGYNKDLLENNNKIVSNNGGEIYFIDNGSNELQTYGRVDNRNKASSNAASILSNIVGKYEENYVCFVDTPFLRLPICFSEKYPKSNNILFTCLLQSDVLIHNPLSPEHDRLQYEEESIEHIKQNKKCYFTDSGDFMTNHLQCRYGVPNGKFIPLRNGLFLSDNRYKQIPEDFIEITLKRYGINASDKVIFSVGRAVPYKGFEQLIRTFALVQNRFAKLVLIASPYKGETQYVEQLINLISELNLQDRVIALYECNFELPKVICQWSGTKIVAQFAKHEPFGLVPEEVRAWSFCYDTDPILLLSNIDGHKEQVDNGVDGFLVDQYDYKNCANLIDDILSNELLYSDLGKSGKQKLIQKFDFSKSFEKYMEKMTLQFDLLT